MESLTKRFNNEVFTPYLDLLKAEYRFHSVFAHAKQIWEEKLTDKELVNGPYLEKSQIYKQGEPLNTLPLHEKTIKTIYNRLNDRELWKHQTDALRLLLAGKNVIIATGTSSGKTLCYQIPIIDNLIRDLSPGLRAVIIYPLNALVNDQLVEWEQMLKEHPQITFARFTGQTPNSQIDYERRLRETIREQLTDQTLTQQELQREVERRLEKQLRSDVPNRLNHRDAIRANPPHVLITNFSMLEYLLERPVDAPIFENARLKFLVLDEVHAYRGVQATEIAFLIRRLKDRLGLETLTCIATSATLGKQDNEESRKKVRKEILTKPTLLSEAAKQLWPNEPRPEEGLQALLEIVAVAKMDESHEDLLPTRLHYFVRTQDGLHICLHKQCPGRRDGKPAFFVSRKNNHETPEGDCPDCYRAGRRSQLVEVVTCRKCGYLYGALQDLGPRRAQNSENGSNSSKPYFDSFSTDLGWAADSFWSYFSLEDEDDDQEDLFLKPAELEWCVVCGKKKDEGVGDNCVCETPHIRKIKIFHRQCPHSRRSSDRENLYSQQKKQLTYCPNCGARNASGLEPVRRFQESDDETGLAMAIPLSHFQVSPYKGNGKPPRKLLCFTDHRQRAAAFPSLLEEETFSHDIGRKIVKIINPETKPVDLVNLGECLADFADPQSDRHDPNFFLPVSRFPDEELDAKGKRNLWIAETFSYFAIPDSARESAEDLGLVAVEYRLKDSEKETFLSLLNAPQLTLQESTTALQVLLGYMRQRKVFTLPKGRVEPNAPAFGRVSVDIAYVLRRAGDSNTIGWLPRLNKDGSYHDNFITNYLRRLLGLPSDEILISQKKSGTFLLLNFC